MRVLKIFLLFVTIGLGLGWLAYTFWEAYQPKPYRIQGQIEAQQYNVGSKLAGRIGEVLVRKGDLVGKGQLIYTILSPEIKAKLSQAMAGQDAAEALATEAKSGARKQQLAAAKDKWQQALAAAQLLEKTYQRIDNLYRDGVVAQQRRDEALTKSQAARFEANAASQMYQMAQEGARAETISAAQSKARMAAGAVAEVEAYAVDTRIESHHGGEVSQILLQAGELAPQGFPVVTLVDMNDAWVVFHVREDHLAEFIQGTEFNATIPALDQNPRQFRVSHVAVMGDFATWRATNSDQGFDMRSFEVEARPLRPVAGLRVGMSVLVEK